MVACLMVAFLLYPSQLVVWNPLCLDPDDGVFGGFDLAAFLRLPHLECLFVCLLHNPFMPRCFCYGTARGCECRLVNSKGCCHFNATNLTASIGL